MSARIGAVLAGGASTRLGDPKALVPLAGRALIEHPLAAVSDAGLEPVVVAKEGSPLPALACRVVREPQEPRHPITGLLAALRDAGEPVVVLGCDMPLVTGEVVAWLAARPGTTVLTRVEGRLQPLLARYAPEAAPGLEAALRKGASLTAAAESLEPAVAGEDELERFGEPAELCFNVNSPEDLGRAEALLRGPRAR